MGRGLWASIILTCIMAVTAAVILREQYHAYRKKREIREVKLLNFAFIPAILAMMAVYFVPEMQWFNFVLLLIMGAAYLGLLLAEKEDRDLRKKLRDNLLCIAVCIAVMAVTRLPLLV